MFGFLLRFIMRLVAMLIIAILVFIAVSVVPIDKTSPPEQDFYEIMQQHLQAADTVTIPRPQSGFSVGYARLNITPSYPTSMAGSGLRRLRYEGVHDSIYVNCVVIDNGMRKVAIVSLDMLLVPPEVTAALNAALDGTGFSLDNTYLSATHTHSSIGNWGKRLSGYLYSGPYDEQLVADLTSRIVESIKQADRLKLPSQLFAGQEPVTGMLYNRVAREAGTLDSMLRVIEIRRPTDTLLIASFAGHATCDASGSKYLSRDYPGVFTDAVERNGYAFAMFMAGAVGSHGCRSGTRGMEAVHSVGTKLAEIFLAGRDILQRVTDSSLVMTRTPLELGEPQFKVAKDWRIRPWLFRSLFGVSSPELTTLRIGTVMLLGTPCDFSGELMPPIDSAAAAHDMQAMVTSFNGQYIGYITADQWYDVDHYETRLMNWYGPGNGAYVTESLVSLVDALAE
ncbi:MAG: neutral/alkaline non-lysosomal ceramidase N-terminal domain-containing protein [Cyclobacteriaceae bacterium]|nr:neutral/alkaline non-lysosomal ceramidase N-terminal domain-containing protein [Cyclobacteriaceae bacterium]